MALIVEDGTGLSNAQSYISVADFQAYWTARGMDYTGEDDETIEIWLILATKYADANYNWDGMIATTDQSLNIPRVNWYDKQGRDLNYMVPSFIKYGVCELAAIRQADNFETTATTGVKSESYGPVSITYSGDGGSSKVIYTTAMSYFRNGLAPVGLRVIPT